MTGISYFDLVSAIVLGNMLTALFLYVLVSFHRAEDTGEDMRMRARLLITAAICFAMVTLPAIYLSWPE